MIHELRELLDRWEHMHGNWTIHDHVESLPATHQGDDAIQIPCHAPGASPFTIPSTAEFLHPGEGKVYIIPIQYILQLHLLN